MSQMIETLNSLGNVFFQFMVRQSWQVFFVFLVVAAATIAFRRMSPVLRYGLWLLVLVKFLLPPSFALVTGAGYWLPRLDVETAPDFSIPSYRTITQSESLAEPSPSERSRPDKDIPPPSPSAPSPLALSPPTVPPSFSPRLTPLAWLMLAWATVVASVLLLMLKRTLKVRSILHEGKTFDDGMVCALAQECQNAVKLRRNVRIVSSPHVSMPCVMGFIRPCVLLPDRLLEKLSRDELRAVLLHEFSHLKRFDPLVSLIQRVVQAFYLFHPAAWITNWMLDRERERAVDDWVLALLSPQSQTYGETLVRAIELAPRGLPTDGGLVCIVESKRELKNRLRRIAQVDRKLVYKLSVASIIALLCLGAVILPLGRVRSSNVNRGETESKIIALLEQSIAAQNTNNKSGSPPTPSILAANEQNPENAPEELEPPNKENSLHLFQSPGLNRIFAYALDDEFYYTTRRSLAGLNKITHVDASKWTIETISPDDLDVIRAAYVRKLRAVVYTALTNDRHIEQLYLQSDKKKPRVIQRFNKRETIPEIEVETVLDIAASRDKAEIVYLLQDSAPRNPYIESGGCSLIWMDLQSLKQRCLADIRGKTARENCITNVCWGPGSNEVTYTLLRFQPDGTGESREPVDVIKTSTHHQLMVQSTDGAAPPYEIFPEITASLSSENRYWIGYRDIAWSPDGSFFTFISESHRIEQLFVARKGATKYRQLALTWVLPHGIAWGVNGDRIAFTGLYRESEPMEQSYEIKFSPEMLDTNGSA